MLGVKLSYHFRLRENSSVSDLNLLMVSQNRLGSPDAYPAAVARPREWIEAKLSQIPEIFTESSSPVLIK
jgi:hypothetical protein